MVLLDRCEGRMKRASTNEITKTEIMMIGITPKNLPTKPPTKSNGPKAATVVRAEKITAVPTSIVPSIAARISDFPFW